MCIRDSYKGLKFKGWMDERGKKIDENTEITDTMRYMEFYAVYDPVSYTHLDVYKRQGICKGPLL